MIHALIASLTIGVSLVTACPAAARQDPIVPQSRFDEERLPEITQAHTSAIIACLQSHPNDLAERKACLERKRAEICAAYALDPATMTVGEIEQLAYVFTPELAQRADERIASLAATADAVGFTAAMAIARRPGKDDACSLLLRHPGLAAYVQSGGFRSLLSEVSRFSAAQMRAASKEIVALAGFFDPQQPVSLSGLADYLTIVGKLGDTIEPASRESLRQSLLSKAKEALTKTTSLQRQIEEILEEQGRDQDLKSDAALVWPSDAAFFRSMSEQIRASIATLEAMPPAGTATGTPPAEEKRPPSP